MVDHEVFDATDPSLVAINGHRPTVLRNITASRDTLHCSCGYVGPTRRARYAETQILRDWREHAGDIAVGSEIVHGEPGMGCHCYVCRLADLAAAGDAGARENLALCVAAKGSRHG